MPLIFFFLGVLFGFILCYFLGKAVLYDHFPVDVSAIQSRKFAGYSVNGFRGEIKKAKQQRFGSGKLEVKIGAGENFYSLLVKNGIDKQEAQEIVSLLKKKIDFRRFPEGQMIVIDYDFKIVFHQMRSNSNLKPEQYVEVESRHVRNLYFKLLDGSKYKITSANGSYVVHIERPKITVKTYVVEGSITSSLFQDVLVGGMKASTLFNILNEYAFLIDFQRDIQVGDRFSFVLERAEDPDGDLIKERAIYSNLTLRGKNYEIFYFDNNYYDRKGKTIKRMLLKTPVDGARITSKFNNRRKHPILGYTKAHKGVDMAVPHGTPIYASGDGVVSEVVLNHPAYGKYVTIRHNREYSTRYAHMSRVGKVKVGQSVSQRQVIGYVGMTGLATGPHLHYEIIRYGKQIDPSGMKISSGKQIEQSKMEAFRKRVAEVDFLKKSR